MEDWGTQMAARQATKKKGTRTKKVREVASYQYGARRVNNPEVGLVTPDSDAEETKTDWAYDPHIDPALQFDPARASIEKVIDDALASNDRGIESLKILPLDEPGMQ